MADHALFIGWGEVPAGREAKALQVFNESAGYYGSLQQEGRIESFEAFLVAAHGGDLSGFFLVRGDREKLDEVTRSEDFQRQQLRAGMVVHNVGAVPAYTGDALGRLMGMYQEAAQDLAG